MPATKKRSKHSIEPTVPTKDRLRELKPGDRFAYRNAGYGTVSFEKGDDVVEIREGRLFTDCFSSEGMQWKDGRWTYEGGGLTTTIVAMEEVPSGKI